MITKVFARAAQALEVVGQRFSAKALILGYHRVQDLENDPWSMCVSPRNFEQHLDVLRRTAQPLGLRQLAESHRRGKVPDRGVVLTFDDGYADNLTMAVPLLERYEAPATMFITTGQIGARNEFWWDELERILLIPDRLPEQLHLTIDAEPCSWNLVSASNYSSEQRHQDRRVKAWEAKPGTRLHFYYSVWDRLRRAAPTARRGLLDKILEWADTDPNPRSTHRALTTRELENLAVNRLIEIGAHTVSHLFLPHYPTAEQHTEIAGSKRYLEDLLGASISSFAYPHGEYNEETLRIVRGVGFETACTLGERAVWKYSHRLRYPRCCVEDWNGDEFEKRIRNWFDG